MSDQEQNWNAPEFWVAWPDDFDPFICHVCGTKTLIAPNPPDRAICPECCGKSPAGHDYEYDRDMRSHCCQFCGEEDPYDAHYFDERY